MARTTRRELLAATTLFTFAASAALARTVSHALPWSPNEAYPFPPVLRGPWIYLTPAEAATIDAIVDRLIPGDELGAGGKDAGCTVFIDRQLAGPFGGHDWLYMQGPFSPDPLPSKGLQSPLTPRQQYRMGLAALDDYCKAQFNGHGFADLSASDQDALLAGLEKNQVKLSGFDGHMLFSTILANTMEGYFADPIYGGNRDMVGWKLVGFPGTRYDYRDVIANPNKPYPLPPVGLAGRPAWGTPT
jgi:gluconate 2-dehydrogenase gamma chain